MQSPPALTGVLNDVARSTGLEVAARGRLAGGVNAGAMRVSVGGDADAVLKAIPRTHARQLDEVLRAERVVTHMRNRGYPTPAWLGVGATPTHVWYLTDFVDADPPSRLTTGIVDQLVEINDLQAGQASEVHDHWRYAWEVVTRRRSTAAKVSGYSSETAVLAERLLRPCRRLTPPSAEPDMVHADLNPSNVLTLDGVVVAIVDIENAGSGTRATDLVTLQWHMFDDTLVDTRSRLLTKVLDLVGWQWAAALVATQVLLQLEWRISLGRSAPVAEVVRRGHRAFDELQARR